MSEERSWLGQLLLGRSGVREDIERLDGIALESETARNLAQHLIHRVDSLELLCEALVELMVIRGIVSREELAVLIAQVDLRDGVQDGALRAGAPREDAPLCHACQRPVNPRREACVYCGTAIDGQAPASKLRQPRTVVCGGCGANVDERKSNFTAAGIRCDYCFASL